MSVALHFNNHRAAKGTRQDTELLHPHETDECGYEKVSIERVPYRRDFRGRIGRHGPVSEVEVVYSHQSGEIVPSMGERASR